VAPAGDDRREDEDEEDSKLTRLVLSLLTDLLFSPSSFQQACSYRDSKDDISAAGYTIYGLVSPASASLLPISSNSN